MMSENRSLNVTKWIKLLAKLTTLLLIIISMITSVGILLINSLLILPAASARNISKNSRSYLGLSVITSVVCGVGGLITSFYINTSAGATIVMALAIVFFVTYVIRKK